MKLLRAIAAGIGDNTATKSTEACGPDSMRVTYDAIAETYDETRLRSRYQLRFDSTERRILRRHLQGAKNVLEVGAGTGRLTGELIAHSKHVTAVDISSGMMEKLRRKFSDTAHLKTHILDVYALEELEGYGSFDFLLSMRMLPHIIDITTTLRILRDSVRPGGLMMVDFWNRQSYVYWKKRGAKVYNNYVNYSEAVAMLVDAGLEVVALEGAGFGSPLDLNLEFLGRTPLKRFAYSIVAICRRANNKN